MKILSIKYKLIFSLSLILISSFIAINVINYQVSKASVREGIINSSLPLTRDNIYSEIQADIMRPIFVSSLMANDTFLKDWAIDGENGIKNIQKYLFEIKEKYNFFTSFFISEKTKKYYHFNGINKEISINDPHDVWYYDFINSNIEFSLDVDINQASNNALTIFINHRLNDYNGNLLGITGVGLQMDKMTEILKKYQTKYHRNIYLIDHKGVIQVHLNQSYIEKLKINDLPGINSLVDKILVTSSHSDIFEYDNGEKHVLLTTRYIPEFNWFLVVEQDQNEALSGILNNFKRSMIFAFFIVLIVISIYIFTVNYFQSKLENMAVTDKLTGAFNRRELEFSFGKTLKAAQKNNSPLSVILIDIDNFKIINDKYGHLIGDLIIKEVVKIINKCIRDNDLLVRWGGDEFLTLTPSPLDTATTVAERIRETIESQELFSDKQELIKVTISCGIAQFTLSDDVDTLTKRADDALYLAKEKGRNIIICENELLI